MAVLPTVGPPVVKVMVGGLTLIGGSGVGGRVDGGVHGNCGMVGTDEKTIGGGVCPGVEGSGGGTAPMRKMLGTTIGGLGGVVVNEGNKLAGTVALPPPAYCGWTTPGSEGGTGAGPTAGPTSGPTGTGTGAVLPPVGGKAGTPGGFEINGGGRIGVPVIGIGVAGVVGLPEPNTGCGIPAIEGGTGAGWIGGVPLDTVGLRYGGAPAAADDDVLPVGQDEPA